MAQDNRLEEPFLKLGEGQDLLIAVAPAFRRHHQLIFIIVQAMDHGDAAAFELLNRLENAQDIRIQLFPIRRYHFRQVTIIQQIKKTMLRVTRS